MVTLNDLFSYIISNQIAFVSLIFSIIAVVISYERAKSANESLSLNAFMKAIEQYGESSVRKKRKHIFENIPNFLMENPIDARAKAHEYTQNIPDIPENLELFKINEKNETKRAYIGLMI